MVRFSEATNRHREYYLTKGRQLIERSASEIERSQIDWALDSDKKSFVARLPENISHDEFFIRLGENSVPKDREVLGGGSVDVLAEQLASAVLYPSIMAEFPSHFGSEAIAGIIDMVGSSDLEKTMNPERDLIHTDEVVTRTGYLINRMLQLGSIEHSHEDRFMIPPRKRRKLAKILEKFDD